MSRFISILLLAALALVSVQCSEDPAELMLSDEPMSRGIAPIDKSETNPNLMTDWENCKTVKLNELGPNGENLEATLPWQNGASTTLNSNFCHDIKAADGWSMLFHTFCKSNVDENLSYMCFYNKFTGYLKVFFYSRAEDLGSSTVWFLSSADRQTPQPLFADLEYFSQPLEGDKNYTVWSATANNMRSEGNSGLSKGWNGFEFRVGEYQPTISTGYLDIDALNTAYINIKIDGVTESTTNGTITTTNAAPTSGGKVVGAVANIGGSKAKELVDSYAAKNLDKSFLGFNIKEVVTSVAKNDYVSAFKSGLGFIFKGLFKSVPTVQEVKLQTNGTVTLQGTADVNLTSSIDGLSFDLEKILSNDRKILVDSLINLIKRPVIGPITTITPQYFATSYPAKYYKNQLGVWNLKKNPIVYYDRYTKFENGFQFTDKDIMVGLLDFNGIADYPDTHVELNDIEVVFNPAIKDYVKSYSVNVGLIDVVGGNRSLDHKGKSIIGYNRDNDIKYDADRKIHVYGVGPLELSLTGSIYNYPFDLINQDTQFYIDWGENASGNRAAVVTLTMDVDYNGKQMSFTESRVYDVDYKPYSPWWMEQRVDNPPYSVVVNRGDFNVVGFDLITCF